MASLSTIQQTKINTLYENDPFNEHTEQDINIAAKTSTV